MDFHCSDINVWEEALSSYPSRLASLNKPKLVSLDEFYRTQLPSLLHSRQPTPYLTRSDLFSLMQWKLTRGKFRPRLLDFISSLDEDLVKSASEKAFLSLPDLAKAVSELTVLKGVGPATASAVLAAYAPDVAPFMSDEAMEVVLGDSKDYSLKRYLMLADKLQSKAKAPYCIWFLLISGVKFRGSCVYGLRCGKGCLELRSWCQTGQPTKKHGIRCYLEDNLHEKEAKIIVALFWAAGHVSFSFYSSLWFITSHVFCLLLVYFKLSNPEIVGAVASLLILKLKLQRLRF